MIIHTGFLLLLSVWLFAWAVCFEFDEMVSGRSLSLALTTSLTLLVLVLLTN